MKIKNILLPGLSLGMAAVLLAPAEESFGFATLGTNLSTSERHVRVYDNFVDNSANNNTGSDTNWPGYNGAELAVWKGAAEWGSELFGDGSGDPLQSVGSGGANFDAYWAGNTDGIGTPGKNIVSSVGSCTGGVLAYCEGTSYGWRIRFCDNAWNWQDGPGNDGSWDIQGILTHEYGHSLGLDHSSVWGSTMYSGASPPATSLRSIEADDIAGVQYIYGVKSVVKPRITNVTHAGGSVTITGSFFSLTNNEVWFTNEALTASYNDPHLKVTGVNANASGTQIVVVPPPGAGSGNVLVKINSTGHASLSNAFPCDLPGTPASATYRNGTGVNPMVFTYTSLPVIGTNWTSQIDGGSVGASGLTFVFGYSGPTTLPTPIGELLIDITTPWLMSNIAAGGSGISPHSIAIPNDPGLHGFPAYTQGFLNNVGGVAMLTNAIDLILGS